MNKQREAIYGLRRDILDGNEGKDYVLGVAERPRRRPGRHPLPGEGRARGVDALGAGQGRHRLLRHRPPRDRPQARRSWATRTCARSSGKLVSSQVRGQGAAARQRADAHARARRDAALRRPRLEGPPARPRPPEGGHRPARLRPARPAPGVQEGELRRSSRSSRSGSRTRSSRRSSGSSRSPRSDLAAERARRERAAPRPVLQGPAGGASAFAAPAVSPGQPARPSFGPPRIGGGTTAPPAGPATPPIPQTVHAEEKIGRNDPCPCGSGKKYKKCHGAAAGTAG